MKLFTLENLQVLRQLTRDKKIVLVGGCFDLLHIGHIKFLEAAKVQGDFLVVMLESDLKIKQNKGKGRPINNQQDRGLVLAALSVVDAVIPLPFLNSAKEYDQVVEKIHPQIIATTAGNPDLKYLRRSAQKVGAKVVKVISKIQDKSTTDVLSLLRRIN